MIKRKPRICLKPCPHFREAMARSRVKGSWTILRAHGSCPLTQKSKPLIRKSLGRSMWQTLSRPFQAHDGIRWAIRYGYGSPGLERKALQGTSFRPEEL